MLSKSFTKHKTRIISNKMWNYYYDSSVIIIIKSVITRSSFNCECNHILRNISECLHKSHIKHTKYTQNTELRCKSTQSIFLKIYLHTICFITMWQRSAINYSNSYVNNYSSNFIWKINRSSCKLNINERPLIVAIKTSQQTKADKSLRISSANLYGR